MKADAVKHGISPRRGMWMVSPSRRRAYGPIIEVRRNTIAWRGSQGQTVATDHETIHGGDYCYANEPPEGYEVWGRGR